MDSVLQVSFTILVGLGVLLTFIPTTPGIPYMLFVTGLFSVLTKFDVVKPWMLAVFAGITLLSIIVDYSAGLIGAKLGGASKTSVIVGLIGLVIGLIVFPPFGALIGLFAGVFLAELIEFKDHAKALKAASYSLVTTVIGALVNIALAITFFILFLIFIY